MRGPAPTRGDPGKMWREARKRVAPMSRRDQAFGTCPRKGDLPGGVAEVLRRRSELRWMGPSSEVEGVGTRPTGQPL